MNQKLNQSKELYVKANDGRTFRYNVVYHNIESDGTYYCENNIIVKDGDVITEFSDNKERYLLIDEYVVDMEQNKVYPFICSCYNYSFVKSINDVGRIECISVTKNKENKNIDINYTNGKQVKIEINKNNAIIGYENNYVSRIEERFLSKNTQLNNISLAQAQTIGACFLCQNTELSSISLPRAEEIGRYFLYLNKKLKSILLPEAKDIWGDFLGTNEQLSNISVPKVEFIGNRFLSCNTKLKEIILPEAKEIGDEFLFSNKNLTSISSPKVEFIGNKFLYCNKQLNNISLPKAKEIGVQFLYSNGQLSSISIPEIQEIGDLCLPFCPQLVDEILEQVEKNLKKNFAKILKM